MFWSKEVCIIELKSKIVLFLNLTLVN